MGDKRYKYRRSEDIYQMAISSFNSDISQLFIIKGYMKEQWHLFEKGINYEAFLAWKK
jgi:hypothetical protein